MNSRELRAQMIRQSKSPEQLWEALGISSSAWYRKVGGKSQFTQGEIVVLRNELALDDQLTAIIFFNEQVS